MRRSGRLNLIVLFGVVGAIVIGVLFLMGGESPMSVGSRFMAALADGDAAELTELTLLDGQSKDEVRKQWDYAVGVAGIHYAFAYQILNQVQSDDDTASVRMKVWRNARSAGTYDENFALPMVRRDGKWLVDVRGINRAMFPALPR